MKQRNKRHIRSSAAAVGIAALLGAAPMAAQACGDSSSTYIGTVCTVAFDFCPDGTLPAKGQTLSIQQYSALYSLLGTVYGGDGRNTFGLPNLQGRVIVGTGTGSGLSPVQRGQVDGRESVTLGTANLPATTPAAFNGKASGTLELPLEGATVTGQSITGNVTVKALNGDNPPVGPTNTPTATANTIGRSSPANIFYPPGNTQIAVPTTHDLGVSSGTVAGKAKGPAELPVSGTISLGGKGEPVVTIPPRLGLTVCIVALGIYPPRPN